MCPWCFVTPACPCRRGGDPPGLLIGTAILALARRLRQFVTPSHANSGQETPAGATISAKPRCPH
jgi:hypothetical protein